MPKQVLHNIAKIYTVSGGVKRGHDLGTYPVLHDGVILIEDGIIQQVDVWNEFWEQLQANHDGTYEFIDMHGWIVTPGLIDPHTHLVFGGKRTKEYALKIAGTDYMEILLSGGGILSTVEATRSASEEELMHTAKTVLDEMLSCGVTTVEAKSGYGLDRENELKQLRVAKTLNHIHPIEVVSTFMGAHALPKEHSDTQAYLRYLAKEVLPAVKEENLAEFADIFCEQGIFGLEETQWYLKMAAELGFACKIHADEMVTLGGTGLAAKLGCVSAEHLMKASKEDIAALAKSDTVAVLLPVTSFHLGKAFADARWMKECGAVMALATDYNPGSSPCPDLIWAMRIASRGYRLLPGEVLAMATINAAAALKREHVIGSIEPGKQADLTWFAVKDFDEVIAELGNPKVACVMKQGRMVYQGCLEN